MKIDRNASVYFQFSFSSLLLGEVFSFVGDESSDPGPYMKVSLIKDGDRGVNTISLLTGFSYKTLDDAMVLYYKEAKLVTGRPA